ncbi:hypothetical protein [Reichenbachiella sp.]|uniref:hypothetical protein n=1 Tax=Reichenbachiella sp. TaxID=2184521 RepID=UPI003B5AE585
MGSFSNINFTTVSKKEKTAEQLEKEEALAIMKRSGVTQEFIDQCLDKHGEAKVHAFEVPLDDTYEEYVLGIVKDPPPPVLNEYLRKAERVPLDAAKLLLNSIWLGGYEGIKKERALMMSFMEQLSNVLVGGQGRTKKLSRSTHP